ncbi:MAG: hypothetical protein QM602_01845 [Microbacterium sp.]
MRTTPKTLRDHRAALARWARSLAGALVFAGAGGLASIRLAQWLGMPAGFARIGYAVVLTVELAAPIAIGIALSLRLPERRSPLRGTLLAPKLTWFVRGSFATLMLLIGGFVGALVGMDVAGITPAADARGRELNAYLVDVLALAAPFVATVFGTLALGWLALDLALAGRPARFAAALRLLDPRGRVGLPPALRLWSEGGPSARVPAMRTSGVGAWAIQLSHPGYCGFLAVSAALFPAAAAETWLAISALL